MKKLTAFILIAVLVIGLMPASVQADEKIELIMIRDREIYRNIALSQDYGDYGGMDHYTLQGQFPAGVGFGLTDYMVSVYGTPSESGTFTPRIIIYNSQNTAIGALDFTIIVHEEELWSCDSVVANESMHYGVGDWFSVKDCKFTAQFCNQCGDEKLEAVPVNLIYGLDDVQFTSEGTYFLTAYADYPVYAVFDPAFSYNGMKTFEIPIVCYVEEKAPVIKTTVIPEGKAGEYYYTQLQASGAYPYWNEYYNPGHRNELKESGLEISSSGQLFGTPEKAGTYEFTLSCSNKGGDSYVTYTLTVREADIYDQYGIHVSGVPVCDKNRDDILGDGCCSYDPGTNILTLDDARIYGYTTLDGSNYFIRSDSSLTVNVEGNCTVYMDFNGGYGIYAGKYLSFIGSGRLLVAGDAEYTDTCGLYCGADMSIDGPEISSMITSDKPDNTAAALMADGDLIYVSGSLSLQGADCGLFLGGKLDADGTKVLLCEGDAEPGIPVQKLSSGENSTLSAKYVSIGLGNIAGGGSSFGDIIKANLLYIVIALLIVIVIILLIILKKKKK